MKISYQPGRESRVESRERTRDLRPVFCPRPSPLGLRPLGFTLIEMILAVGVAALVLTIIGSVFFAALHLREVTQAAVDAATPALKSVCMSERTGALAPEFTRKFVPAKFVPS